MHQTEQRNCRFFPEELDASRQHAVWFASYERGKDDTIELESTMTAECPTSLVTPDVEWMLQQFHSNRMDAKAGATMYGSDARKWPAWWADVVELLTFEYHEANRIQGITE